MCVRAQATTRAAKTRHTAATGPSMAMGAHLGGPNPAGAAPDPPVAAGNSLHDMPLPPHVRYTQKSSPRDDGTGGDARDVGGQL